MVDIVSNDVWWYRVCSGVFRVYLLFVFRLLEKVGRYVGRYS